MELRDLLRLCNGRQVHDLILFQKRLPKALKRIELRVCECKILFWEQIPECFFHSLPFMKE